MAEFRAPIAVVLLAQAGDRRAFEELLQGIGLPLHNYLVQLVNDSNLADDILQDVFVLMWRKLTWLRDPELFRPWIYRIANREAFRRLKNERTWRNQLGAELQEIAEPIAAMSDLPEWIDKLPEHVSAISPASRVVLLLHYQQGMTLDEVATVLDLSLGTVKSRLGYGLNVLRQRLGKGEN